MSKKVNKKAMFTGIVEAMARVSLVEDAPNKRTLGLKSAVAARLSTGDSVAHNGVCLTVTETSKTQYKVEVGAETLKRTNLGELKVDALLNIERSVAIGARLDGHFVTGHVDERAICVGRPSSKDGIGEWTFEVSQKGHEYLIEKGSVTLNGVSLTIYGIDARHFKLYLVPHTASETNLAKIPLGGCANVEFDMIGKYVHAYLRRYVEAIGKRFPSA